MSKAGFVALIGEPNAGKIDIAQHHGGKQNLDRHPQGTNHTGAYPRCGARGREPNRLCGYTRTF